MTEQQTTAEKRLQAITEAVVLWRDRPGGDVGLAIALADILDAEQPEPPASAALVRVLRECDRIERAVRAQPTSPDFDGGYLSCLRHIREAAGPVPPGAEPHQAAVDRVRHIADQIEAGAPWHANADETARRIRDAIAGPPAAATQHTSGNAEDCPACVDNGFDMLAYPWTCPGPGDEPASRKD